MYWIYIFSLFLYICFYYSIYIILYYIYIINKKKNCKVFSKKFHGTTKKTYVPFRRKSLFLVHKKTL